MSQDPQSHPEEHPSELFMLLDEKLAPGERRRLLDRLAECPDEKAHLEEVLGTGRLVEHFSIASRDYCPDQETLMAGASNELGIAKTALFRKHVDSCAFCASDIADFQALTAPTSMELVFKMGQDALQTLKNSFGSLLSTAPVPVFRGDAATAQGAELKKNEAGFERRDGDIHWTVVLRKDASEGPLMKVTLTRKDQPCHFTTLLFLNGQVIDGRSAKDGAITIEGLEAGSYELVVKESSRRENAWKQVEEASGDALFEDSILLQFE